MVILCVGLEVFGQLVDARREQSDLSFRAASVIGGAAVLLEYFLLLCTI